VEALTVAGAVLEGALVRLRPEAAEDIPLFVRWFSDPDVLHWLHLSEMPSATIESETEKFERHQREPGRIDWVIETAAGVPVGGVSLVGIDDVHGRAEVGISIGEKECWKRGLGTDTLRTVLRHAFTALGLRRVTLIADADNERAIACYEKCGFRMEGLLREHRLRYGKPLDMVAMAILAEDYREFSQELSRTCPQCSTDENVVPIAYGLPGPELLKEEERGEVLLGGCVVGEAAFHCKSCGAEFGRRRPRGWR
jgi:RimJ/RimL family protein N-acetyltransferase